MRCEPDVAEAREHRLHPASLLFSIGSAARRLLLPGLIVLVAARGSPVQYWIMLAFVPAVVAALVRYWSYRYRFAADELVVREGVVTRNERHVPYARIQNIDLVQNVLHRLLGVAEVRVETAGGEKPEAVLRVLSLAAVDHMRAQVFAVAAGGTPAARMAESARLLHAMSWRDVLLFGAVSNKGMVVVAAALGVLWQFDFWERLPKWLTPERLGRFEGLRRPSSLVSTLFWGLGAIVVLVILMRILSIVWGVLKFHGFRLRGRGDDLRAEHGLLTRVSKTIPRHRIQVLSTLDGPLHRFFGTTSVQVQTAGSRSDPEGGASGRLWLAPLIDREAAGELLRHALPEVPFDEVSWRPIAARAWVRLLRRRLIVLAPSFAAAAWALHAWQVRVGDARLWAPPVAVALLGWAWLDSRLQARYAAWALVSGAILYRSGWWVRRLGVVRFGKIQAVECKESPFDRRNRMATVGVDTAGAGALGHGFEIPLLDSAIASALAERLGAEAGRTPFRW